MEALFGREPFSKKHDCGGDHGGLDKPRILLS